MEMDPEEMKAYSRHVAAQAADVLGDENEAAWRFQDALDSLYDALVEGGVPSMHAASAIIGMASARMLYTVAGGER